MRGLAGWLIALTACNSVYTLDETRLREYFDAKPRPDADPRIDRDQDGIKDVDDPCIAPWTDALVDRDGDMIVNRDDACPFDAAPQSDTDGDGIGDACDPEAGPNRVRCVMTFTDPDLSTQLWTSRVDYGWRFLYSSGLYGRTGVSVAQWPFEAQTGLTRYDIIGTIYPPIERVAVIPRIATEADDGLVGCAILFDGATWSLVTSTQKTILGPARTATSYPFRLRITLDAATSRYSCRVDVEGIGAATLMTEEGELYGNLGFAVDTTTSRLGSVYIQGLAIYGQ